MTPMPPTPQGNANSETTPSAMPVVALVFSIIGVCFPPFLLVGLIVGIIALTQKKGSKGPAIAAVVMPAAAIPIIGILAAIAIPNFIRFESRSKQSECKTNLKAAYTAEKSYFAEFDAYDSKVTKVGFIPERGNRYLYLLGGRTATVASNSGAPAPIAEGVGADTQKNAGVDNAKLLAAIPSALLEQVGVQGTCPTCDITIVCAGNIDTDKTVDVWSISSAPRTDPNGAEIPAGVPFNDVSDVQD